jgi:hypothetical protein
MSASVIAFVGQHNAAAVKRWNGKWHTLYYGRGGESVNRACRVAQKMRTIHNAAIGMPDSSTCPTCPTFFYIHATWTRVSEVLRFFMVVHLTTCPMGYEGGTFWTGASANSSETGTRPTSSCTTVIWTSGQVASDPVFIGLSTCPNPVGYNGGAFWTSAKGHTPFYRSRT